MDKLRLSLRDSKRLRYGFFLFLLVIPLYGFPLTNVGSRALRWDWILAIGLVILFIKVSVIQEQRFLLHIDRITLGLIAFTGALILSLYTPLVGKGAVIDHITTLVQYLLGIGLFVTATHTSFRRQEVRVLLRLYILVATAIAILGLLQFVAANIFNISWVYFDLPNVTWDMSSGYVSVLGFRRATSIFAEPRHFGNFLLTPFFVLVVTFASNVQPFNRSTHILVSALVMAGIFVSFSASAFLVFLVSVVLVPVLVNGDLRMTLRYYTWIAAIVIIVGGLVIIFPVGSDDILFTLKRLVVSEDVLSATLRLDFQTLASSGKGRYIGGALAAFLLFANNPLVGIGLNQFYKYYPDFWILPPFDLLASTGIIGTATFVYFIVVLFRRALLLKSNVSSRQDRTFLQVAVVLVAIAILKSALASNYNYASTWFWFDISFAGVLYYSVLANDTEVDQIDIESDLQTTAD